MALGRHVLVVGGAGYVGNVLVRRLLAAGHRVRVLDRLLFDHGTALAGLLDDDNFSFQRGDLREDAALEPALDGITDVVLLAALVGDPICRKYPDLARSVNDDGSKALFDRILGSGVDRFVFTSTCSNYGLRESDAPATEDSDLAPLSLYAETKVQFEQFVLSREAEWDLCPTLLRIATAYGLSQRMRFDLTISEFTRTLTLGEELVVYDADTWRPYCHVADISKAIMTVIEAPEDSVRGEVFNVGHSDENYTKQHLVEHITQRLGRGDVTYVHRDEDPRDYRVSFERIKAALGYEPLLRVPDGIDEIVEGLEAERFGDPFSPAHSNIGVPA
jgi:nucleoside-diphosphate-sugar epimerase